MSRGSQLERQEVSTLKAIYDYSLKEETDFITVENATRELLDAGLSKQEIQESLDILLGKHLIEEYAGKKGSGQIHTVKTNVYGFTTYGNLYIPDIDQIYNSTLDAIVNKEIHNNKELAADLNLPKMVIEYMLDILKHNGLIKAAQFMGRDADYIVTEITTEAKRLARKLKKEKQQKAVEQPNISDKEDKRNRILMRIYRESNGNRLYAVPDEVIIQKEGIAPGELNELQQYLVEEGYIKYLTFGHTAIEHRGIKQVEEQLQQETKLPKEIPPPVSFPPHESGLIDVLDRKYSLIQSKTDESFLLELEPFMSFIRENTLMKPYSDMLLQELQGRYEKYTHRIEAEKQIAVEIKDMLISTYPDMDDSTMERPTTDTWDYENSFAEFQNIRNGNRTRFGYPLFSPGKYHDDTDVGKLIQILKTKVSRYKGPEEEAARKIDKTIEYKLQDLEVEHQHTHRSWINY